MWSNLHPYRSIPDEHRSWPSVGPNDTAPAAPPASQAAPSTEPSADASHLPPGRRQSHPVLHRPARRASWPDDTALARLRGPAPSQVDTARPARLRDDAIAPSPGDESNVSARHIPASNSPEGFAVLTEIMCLSPRLPAELKALLSQPSTERCMRAHLLQCQFERTFRPLAEQAGPVALHTFNTEGLPALRQAALVCAALELDHLPTLQRWLDQGLRADQRFHRYAPLFKLPALALGWLFAATAMMAAPELPAKTRSERPACAATSADGQVDWLCDVRKQSEQQWLGWMALMAAAPLMGLLDSVLDAGWRSLRTPGLLDRDVHFNNELAEALHARPDRPDRSERAEALRDGLTGLALAAGLRVGGGVAATAALPHGLRMRSFLGLDAAAEALTQIMLPHAGRSLRSWTDPSSPETHLQALSSDRFMDWATRSSATHPSVAEQLRTALGAMVGSLARPSTWVRAALALAPSMAIRGLSLYAMPYPGGPHVEHLFNADRSTADEGPPIDPLIAAIASSMGALSLTCAAVAAVPVRRWAERVLDPAARTWTDHAWQQIGRGHRRVADALGLHRAGASASADRDIELSLLRRASILSDEGVGVPSALSASPDTRPDEPLSLRSTPSEPSGRSAGSAQTSSVEPSGLAETVRPASPSPSTISRSTSTTSSRWDVPEHAMPSHRSTPSMRSTWSFQSARSDQPLLSGRSMEAEPAAVVNPVFARRGARLTSVEGRSARPDRPPPTSPAIDPQAAPATTARDVPRPGRSSAPRWPGRVAGPGASAANAASESGPRDLTERASLSASDARRAAVWIRLAPDRASIDEAGSEAESLV